MPPKVAALPAPPGDYAELVQRLRAEGTHLPPRLRQVAGHMLAHPEDMAFQTTAEIAARAGVQPSTLVRFAQALDYPGFSDLQQVFRNRLRRESSDHRARLAALRGEVPGESGMARTLLDGFIRASQASLETLSGRADAGTIDAAAEILARAGTVYLVGARRMFPVVSYLAYAFGKLGIRAVLVDNVGGLGAEQAAMAGAGDAMIAVSFAPYTPQTVGIARDAHRNGVPVIALTDGALSPLAVECEILLEVVEADFGAFRSMAATFALAMTLSVATAEKIRADA
ncbi:MAG: MurR/RpiR family transcriptional regulator [Beijerinckiaceae bacterium]|nr:MurR/RpiR family transcriptional regulator [Beijerinckiaceae bacterium]MCZ8300144.1 MurR/RpiR family transcriptional regulator [Beijerinckiaceae bacterium]